MASSYPTLFPGFKDPVFDSQSIFRIVLDAMARPGRILKTQDGLTAPNGLTAATGRVCLCLLDQSMTLWLDTVLRTPDIDAFLTFHTGCDVTDDPQQANFAVVADAARPLALDSFNIGMPEYPDRSTTVIVQTRNLHAGNGVLLTGPGIETGQQLAVEGLTAASWQAIARNNALYPLGVDILFTADDRIAGLPRSTNVGV